MKVIPSQMRVLFSNFIIVHQQFQDKYGSKLNKKKKEKILTQIEAAKRCKARSYQFANECLFLFFMLYTVPYVHTQGFRARG